MKPALKFTCPGCSTETLLWVTGISVDNELIFDIKKCAKLIDIECPHCHKYNISAEIEE